MAMEAPLPSKRCKLYWEAAEQQSILQLMLGSASADRALGTAHRHGQHDPTTAMVPGLLDGSAHSLPLDDPLHQKFNDSFELDSDSPLPPGWEKCLDLKTGSIYYMDRNTGVRTLNDPRKKQKANAQLPPSPSSSELTTEPSIKAGSAIATEAKPTCKRKHPVTSAEEFESDSAVDLTLSLGPCSSKSRSQNEAHPQLIGLLCQNQSEEVAKEAVVASYNHSPRDVCRGHGGMNVGMLAAANHHQTPLVSDYEHYAMKLSRPANRLALMESLVDEVKLDEAGDEGVDAMITAGCPHCLMFVMMSRSSDPRCPRCGAAIRDSVNQMEKPPTPFSASATAVKHTHRFC